MPIEIFIERSRLGKVFYDLRDGHLSISGWRGLEKCGAEVELHAMSHRVEMLGRRFWRPILLCGGIGCALISVAVALVLQKVLPPGAVMYFAEIAGIFGAVFLATGLRWIPRLEVVRFKDVVGRTNFDIIREARQAREVDRFVEMLQLKIKQSKAPNQTPEPTAAAGRGSS